MKNMAGFLEHLLRSTGDTVTGANQKNRTPGVMGAINSDFGRGTLAGGALGLLLGKKKKTRKLASYGGLAALGVMVYNTYSEYQKQQGQAAPVSSETSAAAQARGILPAATAPEFAQPQTVDRLDGEKAAQHCDAILRAIIAAAKADGHIDERERGLIEDEYLRLGLGPQMQQWLHAELQKPLDPAEVAQAARTPEMAGEMYLASLLVVDEQSFMERAYLEELARQLRLPPDLQARLQRSAQAS